MCTNFIDTKNGLDFINHAGIFTFRDDIRTAYCVAIYKQFKVIVHRTGKASRSIPCPSIVTKRESTRHREASSSFRAAQILRQGPLNPILRANPFPEAQSYISNLPIFLIYFIFYWLESVKLGNLLRIRVRKCRESIRRLHCRNSLFSRMKREFKNRIKNLERFLK